MLLAQQCPDPPGAASAEKVGGSSRATRLRHGDPLVREMARADLLYDQGRSEQAEAIYRQLARTPADKRQTARRAKLNLAQVALAREQFDSADELVAAAISRGALQDVRARGRRLHQKIAQRRAMAGLKAKLDAVDSLVEAGRLDEATAALNLLLQQPCPHPVDFPARLRVRLSQVQRARGDFALARISVTAAAVAATTAKVREHASEVAGEIDAAARTAWLQARVDGANAMIDLGDAAGAIAALQPMLDAQPRPPPEVEARIRLRLARAYGRSQRFDEALAVLQPLLAPGAEQRVRQQAARSAAGIKAAEFEAVARTVLTRGSLLLQQRDYAEAAHLYRELLGWNPPPPADVVSSARLGLARAESRRGNVSEARQQIAHVQASSTTPRLLERATELLSDIDEEQRAPDGLSGYVQFGAAYDSNAPTLVSASREQADDIPFPRDRQFEDGQTNLSGRLEYRETLGSSDDYVEFSASGLRTFQFDLSELDRSVVAVRLGPVLTIGHSTRLRIGALFVAEWRDSRFRESERAVYLGFSAPLATDLSTAATYTLSRHNDYRDELDGIHHALHAQLRYLLGETDQLTVLSRAKRENAALRRFRNWSFLAGVGWRHRWNVGHFLVPFIEATGTAERVLFDSDATHAERHDWKMTVEPAAGADLGRRWRVRVDYAMLDINSNQGSQDRLANHRVEVSIRYSY